MKIDKYTTYGIALLIGILLAKGIHAMPQKPQNISEKIAVISEIDKFITQAHEQLQDIKKLITLLNSVIVKEKKYPKERQKAIQQYLADLMNFIEVVEHEQFRTADIQSCQTIIHFNATIADHLNNMRSNHFKQVESFKVDDLLAVLHTKKEIDSTDLFKRFYKTSHVIQIIRKEGLGLSIFNKIARWTDDTIISPSLRYSLPSRSLMAGGTLFLGSYFWWRFAPSNFEKHMNSTIYKYFYGPHPIPKKYIPNVPHQDPSKSTNEDPNENKYGLFARIDRIIIDYTKGFAPLGALIGTPLLAKLGEEYFKNIHPALSKKMRAWLNRAKGGAYIQEADRIEAKTEKVRFSDIYGQDEIKRFFQFLVDYIEDSETHDRQGIRPPHGILCIGDTRTGKTHCINAFLEEVNQMLIRTNQIGKYRLIKPSLLELQMIGMEVILKDAQRRAPCILFIDEIDVLDLQRRERENSKLGEWLTSMSDILNSNDSKKQVFIIAATNRPETLDKALRQPGRFGKELRFEYPNYSDRYNYLKTKISEFLLPGQEKQINFERLVLQTHNQSYEKMSLFIKNAAMKAKLNNNGIITQQHLEDALEEDIYHIIPTCRKSIPDQERAILASYFAGQALILQLLDTHIKLAKVTIKQVMTELKEEAIGTHLYEKDAKIQQRFEYGKIFTYHDKDPINIQTREQKLALIKLHIAGFVAEKILMGSCGYSCHAEQDNKQALDFAKSLSFKGIEQSTLPKNLIKKYYDEALALISESEQEVTELLQKHTQLLEQLQKELLKRETLDQDEIAEIVAKVAAV